MKMTKKLFYFMLLLGIVFFVSGCCPILPWLPWCPDGLTRVPNVVGLSLEDAGTTLSNKNFDIVEVQKKITEDEDPGTVLRQIPISGILVPSGTAVTLVVAQMPLMVVVPNVVGMLLEDAGTTLSNKDLSIGEVHYSIIETRDPGTVLSQMPISGERVLRGFTEVTLVVACMPREVDPDTTILNSIIVLCVDGYANKGEIYNAVESAADDENVQLSDKNYCKTGSKTTLIPYDSGGLHVYMNFINDMVSLNGDSRSNLKILIVGKSYGGAKMYRFLYDFAWALNDFNKVAVVLVDAHEPMAPGDEGMADYWYDYVCLTGSTFNDNYNLKWWIKWNNSFNLTSSAGQGNTNAKLRVFNIYQRNKYPRGYKFSSAYRNNSLTGVTVKSYINNEYEEACHFNIDNCDKTVDLIKEAFQYLTIINSVPIGIESFK